MSISNAIRRKVVLSEHWCLLAVSLWSLAAAVPVVASDTAKREFFETRIRPVLVEHCYSCHNSSDTTEGGLGLDHRAALLKGGDSGKVVIAGDANSSRLLRAIRHEIDGLEMPDGGPKLDGRVIADFERWIADGAFDPRDRPPTADELADATSWDAVMQRRKQWWSFQPIRDPPIPDTVDNSWSDQPIDQFILARLEEAGIRPAADASRRTLIRRLSFALTGLPPSPSEIDAYLSDESPDAYERLVDRLLDSQHFGERWARHWMDWIRYAESHGSEGDPDVVNAWHYRDYLIRALNADVGCDQLLREHVAGDLLDEPRIDRRLGLNESLIGTAHWRMVFHGFAPTDALDEKVRFTDDQINVFSKAFLGLTVSCARCHDHKFDAISQKDYYALFGVLGSCRPARRAIELPEIQAKHVSELSALKPRIRDAIAAAWLVNPPNLSQRLLGEENDARKKLLATDLFRLWREIQGEKMSPSEFADKWRHLADDWKKTQETQADVEVGRHWDLTDANICKTWYASGVGCPNQPIAAGGFTVSMEEEQAIASVYPTALYSHALSTKHGATLTSPDVHLDDEYSLWLYVCGNGNSTVRYVVQDYPRDGTVYPVTPLTNADDWRWVKFELSYWKGDNIHIELTTSLDAPLLVRNEERSWFGVREARLLPKGAAEPVSTRALEDPLFLAAEDAPPSSFADLAGCYERAIAESIRAWRDDQATDGQSLLIAAALKAGLLPNKLSQLADARPLIEEYRKFESDVPVAIRTPTLAETVGRNQPLFVRGDHKRPGDPVPRRFLEAIDESPYESALSGRRRLAEDLLRDDNPLTRRVIVNRLWHHLFGIGIVSTPDNLGRMGAEPTHPELLDYLAIRFAEEGWSFKKMIRRIVTSRTWRLAATPSAEEDPQNRLHSHANVRRLEAEAIRDSLLAVSGKLDATMFGPPTEGNSPRRSIYVRSKRNSLDPFLRIFDLPEPFSTVGRRDVTNVPAQALTMMNDPAVEASAVAWAMRVTSDSSLTDDADRIQRMFTEAFGRRATQPQLERAADYVEQSRRDLQITHDRIADINIRLADSREEIGSILTPTRRRLQDEVKSEKRSPFAPPAPLARWRFDEDLKDSVGSAHATTDSPRIEGGALVVDGSSFAIAAIDRPLSEKTLEAWVQLDNLEQRGGGVVSVQTPDGVLFDAIVYGEQNASQWLAGSNNFARTKPFAGPLEAEGQTRPVHIAIAYHNDGRIVAYREGMTYGTAYNGGALLHFPAGKAVVSFGLRHLPAGGNRFLRGRIFEARLYDRALSDDEMLASFEESATFVSDADVLAALSDADRSRVATLGREIDALKGELASLGDDPGAQCETAAWTELARALFLFKEFIYIW